jgi:tetratricopeptide (TPR) repeat protein
MSYLAHNNLGVALASQGKVAAAIAQYAEALRLKPDYANARNSLGVVLYNQGKIAAAAAQYSEALRLKPGYASAHNNLGVVLLDQGKFGAAAAHFTEALRVHPGYIAAYNNLGVALAAEGKFGAAGAHFAEAVRLDPGYGEAYNNLAWLMAACPDANYRDGNRALESATRACELAQWNSSKYLNTLAAAHAECGDFYAAVKWQTRALELLKDERQQDDYRARLTLYQVRKPYRQVSPR